MITINDVALYIGIDYYQGDEMVTANLQRAVASAPYRLYSTVGRDVEELMPGDPRIEELLLMYAEESYDNRQGGSAKQDAAKRHLRDTYEDELRLELRRAREQAAGGGSA